MMAGVIMMMEMLTPPSAADCLTAHGTVFVCVLDEKSHGGTKLIDVSSSRVCTQFP